MKKIFIAFAMIFLLSIPILNQVVQEVEFEPEEVDFEKYVIGSVPVLQQIQSPDHNPYVKVLCVGLTKWGNPSMENVMLDFSSKWDSSQDWRIVIVIVNYSDQDVLLKHEIEMMYNDGRNRLRRRYNSTINSGRVYWLTSPVNNFVSKGIGNIFTLRGRVWGAGLGNSNEVKSQAYIY